MSLEKQVELLTAAILELVEAIKEKGAAPSTTTPETPKPNSAKAETVAAPTKPKAAKPAAKPAAPVEEPAAKVTKKELAETTIELAKAKGREVAIKVLSKYGASKVPDLTDESVWSAVLADLQAALK